MSPRVVCRVAGWEDLAEIVDLLNDDELGQVRNPHAYESASAHTDVFAPLVGQSDDNFIVAEVDGQIVGCQLLTFMRGLSRNPPSDASDPGIESLSDA